MSYELYDDIADGVSTCCSASVIDPSGENIEGICSDCKEHCGIVNEATAECEELGEHMKRTFPVNGYDVCFNCGGRE